MRAVGKLCRVGMWIALVFTLLFQALTVIGLSGARAAGSTAAQGFIVGIAVSCAALVAGTVLLYALRRHRRVALALLILGGCGMVFVGVALHETAGYDAIDMKGITTWEMIYRHLIGALVPVFAGVAEMNFAAVRKMQEVREMAHRSRQPDEKDGSTLGL